MGMLPKFVVYITIFIILFGLLFNGYNTHIYQADQAKEMLWRARATNDLTHMEKYLIQALELLEPYHGNPKWLFPAPDTDYDLIKTNIEEIIQNCKDWSGQNLTDFAYQQAINNLQETIVEIAEHVELANAEIYLNPITGIGVLTWIFSLYALLGWLILFIGE